MAITACFNVELEGIRIFLEGFLPYREGPAPDEATRAELLRYSTEQAERVLGGFAPLNLYRNAQGAKSENEPIAPNLLSPQQKSSPLMFVTPQMDAS
jgi:hypothetical protein